HVVVRRQRQMCIRDRDKKGIQLIDKNGKPRTRDLYPSLRLMKTVQKRIHVQLLKAMKLPDYAFGGVAKRDNILNAKMHQGNKFFFNTDLRNFYPGITHQQVFEMFVKRNFSPTASRILTKLTTYKGMLPQGTPTSPYLANLVFVSAGMELEELATKNGLTFTTFVDDITISSKTDFKPLVNDILAIITSKGFKISHNKTFYQTKQPKVTNVIVNNNNIRLPEAYKKKIDGFEDKETPQAKGT
ncbi:reverse transcriptase family protein, partial [Pedobacter sp. ASV12]|uniref:reverse transcriptase family protein n=1 Tax=Pedobacter sp. ASV12 TaxID=2795120 RepID=UPI0018ED4D33